MMERKQDVSVIIPVYNGAAYLERCLQSVIRQTLKSLEVVCVDDGSTDMSYKILRRYARLYPDRIKVFHIENQGVWKAREYGIEHACGTYIGFLDCDDFIDANMYEILYTLATEHHAEMAVCAYKRITCTGKIEKTVIEMNTWKTKVWSADQNLYKFSLINTALWNKLILRQIALKHIHFNFPPRVTEDALFLMSIYPHIHCVVFSDMPLYHYYMRVNTAMSFITLDEVDNILQCFSATKTYMRTITGDERWNNVIELTSYIHLGASLLLRCPKSESNRYIKKVNNFFRKEFSETNPYLKRPWKNGLMKIGILKTAYTTKTIYLLPYMKKYFMKLIKW